MNGEGNEERIEAEEMKSRCNKVCHEKGVRQVGMEGAVGRKGEIR